MVHQQGLARTAGLLYLIVVLTGLFSLAYVPGQLLVAGDVAASLTNIAAREPLYRLSIAASMLCYTAFALLPMALYRLLAPWGRDVATAMVALALVSVPIGFAALQDQMNLLSLVVSSVAGGAAQEQRMIMAEFALESSNNALRLVKVFWGLWLLPLGILVLRSRAVPRVLGLLLIAGCLGYLVDIGIGLLAPGALGDKSRYIRLPAAVGEIGTCLWLLLFGVRASQATARSDGEPSGDAARAAQ